jgi:hypothetical protein
MAMKQLSLAEQNLFSDLVQRCLMADMEELYPANGSFTQLKRSGRSYWYYQGYALDPHRQRVGKRYSKYIGLVCDPHVDALVAEFGRHKADYNERRSLVSLLRGAGLPAPSRLAGDVVEALAKGGLFRLRAVLVGTVAFQTYAGLLGCRLPAAQVATADVDFAQFHSIAVSIEDQMDAPILDSLRMVDSSYRGVPNLSDAPVSTAFANDTGFRVEFLTPNQGRAEFQDQPAAMPALRGASAQPLRYLGFLIHEPVWSALLHNGGVAVRVPRPARYAVHKLILWNVRKSDAAAKRMKDLHQAAALIDALASAAQFLDLGQAWIDAWNEGPKWRTNLGHARTALPSKPQDALAAAVSLAAESSGRLAQDFGFAR